MPNARIEINTNYLQENITKLLELNKNYNFKLIDLRNNFWSLGIYLVNILANNFDYGFTTNISDALKIRKYNRKFPILIKEEVLGEEIYDAINNNLTITISNLNNLQDIANMNLKDDVKIHLLIDNGANCFGLKTHEEVSKAISIINSNKHLLLEGIYSEITTLGIDEEYYYQEVANFLKIIEHVDQKDLIIHLNENIMYHQALKLINGLKLDLSIIGLLPSFNNINKSKYKKITKKYQRNAYREIPFDLKLVFNIVGFIKSINYFSKNMLIGRNYLVKEELRGASLNIGHKDGITKALKVVVVNNHICDILTDNVDEIFIRITDKEKIGDKVYLIGEYNNIDNVLLNLKTNRYYLMSILNCNLPRLYIFDEEEIEVNYF